MELLFCEIPEFVAHTEHVNYSLQETTAVNVPKITKGTTAMKVSDEISPFESSQYDMIFSLPTAVTMMVMIVISVVKFIACVLTFAFFVLRNR